MRRRGASGGGSPLTRRLGHAARSAVLVIALAAASGCGAGADEPSDAEVTVVATTTQVADLVRNVGSGRAEVTRLLDPGVDPHDYEPRPSDAAAIADAAVVFQSGGDLDAWLGDLVENAGGDAPVVTLADSVAAVEGEAAEDPHWWQDPRNAITAVEAIGDALGEADPGGARIYAENADSYVERLERLDREIARCMERVPEQQRKLVTTHDSYGYFAARYDIELIGAVIPSRSTQAQASAGESAALVDQIQAEDVNAVFPESAPGPDLEQAIAGEAGAEVGEPLWGDSLGPEGSDGATYLDAMAADTAALVSGFTGGEQSCHPEPGRAR